MSVENSTRVGIIGRGAIGRPLIDALRDGRIPGHVLDCVLARSRRERWEVERLADLLDRRPDLVIEAAGQGPVREMAAAILAAGCDLMLFSVGALADPATEAQLTAAVAKPGAGRLLLTTGAVGGLDIIKSLCCAGEIDSVSLRSTTKPQALIQSWMAPERAEDIARTSEPITVFDGTAREASTKFPSVANVSAVIALSSIGLDRVMVALIADPDARAKTHEITIRSADSTVSLRIENAFSNSNPRTSRITPFAVIRWMQDQCSAITPGV